MRFQKLPDISKAQAKTLTPELLARAKSLAICSTPQAREKLSYDQAVKLCALPLSFSAATGVLQFAVSAESESILKPQLKFATSSEVSCVSIDPQTLGRAIEIAYRADDSFLEKGLEVLAALPDNIGQQDREDFSLANLEAPVPNALRTLLEYAIAKDASDIHLIPISSGLSIKLRVNGELLSHHDSICSVEAGKRLISRIKILASLRIDEKHIPQDGAFSLPLKSSAREFRVSTLPTVHGEKCVLRLTSDCATRNLESCGLSVGSLEAIERVIDYGSGLILATGATGSGKSSTLYAIAQRLLTKNLNICSVEDPVESLVPGISQTSLAPERGLDYPGALRAILRQDPDVILVGEIRDLESAKLVISAALTGHLVLSTVHGANLADSISRLIQIGIDKALLSQVIKLILNQSLLRKLCARCKVLDLLNSERFELKVFKPVGCALCDYSGYDGRLLVAERMLFSNHEKLADFLVAAECSQLNNLKGYESVALYLKNYLEAGLIAAIQR